MEHRKLEVGDVLYNADPQKNNSFSPTPTRKVKIERVTKTQAVTECGKRLERETTYGAYSERGAYGYFYFGDENSEKEYQLHLAKVKLQEEYDKLKSYMQYRVKWREVSLKNLREIYKILTKPKP